MYSLQNFSLLLFAFLFFTPLFAQKESQINKTKDYKDYLLLSYEELDSLTDLNFSAGALEKTILVLEAAKEKSEKEFGKEDTLYIGYCLSSGFLYKQTGQYDIAMSLFKEAESISEKALGREHASFANALNNLADLHQTMGNYDLALPLFKEAKKINEKTLGKENATYAMSLNNLAYIYQVKGNYKLALPLLIEAIDIQKKVLGEEHPDLAVALNGLAYVHLRMGDYDLALPLFIECTAIFETALGEEHPYFASTMNSLANLYQSLGNYELALPLYIKAKEIRKKVLGKEHADYATALDDLAGLHKKMDNYDLALPLYKQAKNIREKTLGKEHPHFAFSLNNLAHLHQTMEHYALALPLFEEAKNIRKNTLGIEHADFAASLGSLGSLHEKMGNYNIALPLFIQAKNVNEKALGGEHPIFAQSVNNLAYIYEKMEHYDLALPLYEQAKTIQEKALSKEHPDLVGLLNNIVGLHQKMGNYTEAWKELTKAINSSSGIELTHTFDKAWLDSLKEISYSSHGNILNSLKKAYELLESDSTVSTPLIKQAIVTDLVNILLNNGRNQVTNDKDKLRFLSQSNSWLLNSLKVLDNKSDMQKAFSLADQNKSVLLFQATKSEAAYRLGNLPDSLVWKDKKLLKKQSELQAQLIEKRPKEEQDIIRDKLNSINQDISNFAKMIKNDFPKYHQLKYQQVDAKIEDIQSSLDNNTALVEYVISDSILHIFCIDNKEIQWERTAISNKKLKYRIKSLHRSLSNYKLVTENKNLSYKEYTEQAHWFYQNILAPVLANKPNVKNLIVVTDGELGHLPFETFLIEKASEQVVDYQSLHYLVNDYNISYNYSATLWKENLEAPTLKNNGQILAVAANYDIKLDSSLLEVRLPTDIWLREQLNALPAARKEVKALEQKYQGFFAFDTLASEKTIKEKATNFAILHFATHGILDSKRPVLSSLAMTEDSDSIESNFWQAHEISKMQLNADLVVLSACETGYGKFEKGNGIASLARAFMYAGSPSLIVSLWQVNDYATSEIMKNLYDNFSNGMKKDEALRQAKLQYMKSAKGVLAHPAFWSPFIQIGNTKPIYIKKKGETKPWLIGGFIVLVLLGGGFLMNRRTKDA